MHDLILIRTSATPSKARMSKFSRDIAAETALRDWLVWAGYLEDETEEDMFPRGDS